MQPLHWVAEHDTSKPREFWRYVALRVNTFFPIAAPFARQPTSLLYAWGWGCGKKFNPLSHFSLLLCLSAEPLFIPSLVVIILI